MMRGLKLILVGGFLQNILLSGGGYTKEKVFIKLPLLEGPEPGPVDFLSTDLVEI